MPLHVISYSPNLLIDQISADDTDDFLILFMYKFINFRFYFRPLHIYIAIKPCQEMKHIYDSLKSF